MQKKKKLLLISAAIIFLIVFLQALKQSRNNVENLQQTVVTADTSVPQEYSELYSELETALNEFEVTYSPEGNHEVIYGADLLTANTHRGTDLLARNAMAGNILYLDNLQKLGVRGVSISMQYPLLLNDYPQSDKYWQFYKDLVQEIRKRGLTIHIDIGPILPQKEYSELNVSYDNLSKEEYLLGKKEIAVRITNELQPDYLTVVNEPDTETASIGHTITIPEYVDFINDVHAEITDESVKLGAGTGTWSSQDYVESFSQTSSLDFIDLHMYPLSNGTTNYLQVLISMIETAKKNDKKVVLGEVWLYKASSSEVSERMDHPDVFARDAFSFWAPLDQKLLETVAKVAEAYEVDYIAPFWSKYYFGYLDYAEARQYSNLRLVSETNEVAVEHMKKGRISETGAFYKSLISPYKD